MTSSTPVRKTTSTKAIVAGIGGTLAAIITALMVLGSALEDGNIGAGEVAGLVTAVVVMVSTIYGVWRVPNKDIPPQGIYKSSPKV